MVAKVLFCVQLILALVVLPWWPGLDPRFAFLGLAFLAMVLALPLAAVVAVHGFRVTARMLRDAWSAVPLGPGSALSLKAWTLAVATFPLAGIAGGLTALAGALGHLDPRHALASQIPVTAFFCLVWGFLGLLLSRILQEVVARLSASARVPLLVITPDFSRRYSLTPREAETAQAVLDGLTYRGAGDQLCISPVTVKSHVLSVYQKTGAGNKIELLRLVEAENRRIHPSVDGSSGPEGRS